MTHQAAQTMPAVEAAVNAGLASYHGVKTFSSEVRLRSALEATARAMLASAPAASGGEDVGRADCGACPKPIGCKVGQCRHGLDNTPESRAPQLPSSASVRERARAIEILAGVCLVPPSSVTENTDSDVSVELALRAIEQALTQQRGECVAEVFEDSTGCRFPRWAPTVRQLPVPGTKLYTAPQPSADAVAALESRAARLEEALRRIVDSIDESGDPQWKGSPVEQQARAALLGGSG